MLTVTIIIFFFFSSRRRHTRCSRDWSSDVCSSDLSPENQTLILAPQFGIKLRRAVASLHQQPTQHFIALLADVSQPLVTAAGILARVQPQITDQLAAVRKTLDRTYGQHEGQSGHRPHAL